MIMELDPHGALTINRGNPILIVFHLYCCSKHKHDALLHHFLCMGKQFTNPLYIVFCGLILTDILLFINSRFCLENAGEEEKRQFLQEIDLMKDVGSHRNILNVLGFWIRSEPIMLIMEYVPHGDLLQWLRNKRQQIKHVTVRIDFLPFSP